jgi:sec-independent protein translocase protein TatA
MFGSFGWMELLLILFIVLIIFGAGKIPQLGEGLGKAIKGFKKSINEPDAVDVTPTQGGQDQPPPSQVQPGQLAQGPQSVPQQPPQAQPATGGQEQSKQG